MANLCLLSVVFLVTRHVYASDTDVKDGGPLALLTKVDEMLGQLPTDVDALKLINSAKHEMTNLIKAEKTERVEQHMKETHFYVPLQLKTRNVFGQFIEWKLKSGTPTEKKYYARFAGLQTNPTATKAGKQEFIASLISKRTRMFVGKLDLTLLRKEHSDITIWLPWHYIGNDTWEQHTEKGGSSNREALYEMWTQWVDKQSKLRNGKYHGDYTLYQMNDTAVWTSFPFEHFSIYNYLSYDEMQLAALLIAAGPTTFYSNCRDRYANRKYGVKEFVANGYIVGIVGPRLELPGVMDFSLLSPSTEEKDKKLRAIVYGEQYEKGLSQSADGYIMVNWTKGNDEKAMPRALRERAFIPWANPNITELADEDVITVPIHRELFQERLKITFGAYFDFVHKTMLELNKGKKEEDLKKAYVIVLPIGAGAWALGFEVNEYIFPAIKSLLEEREYAKSIDTIHLTGNPAVWKEVTRKQEGGVDISKDVISGPTATQKKNEQGELVDIDPPNRKTVRFFAFPWDSNALPGNEFWFPVSTNWHGVGDKKTELDGLVGEDNGVLQWSGDPAAACCSDIIFTQNWIHNEKLTFVNRTHHDWKWLQPALPKATPKGRRLQAKQENAEEEEMNIDRELLTSGLRSYSFYSVVLVTVVLGTAMFIVSFFWRVV